MSKVQDTIHRFVVDATIVVGCVCLAVTAHSAIRTLNNVNGAITQFNVVTMPQLNNTINESRILLEQLNGKGVVDGGVIDEARKTINSANSIFAQLEGKDVSGVTGPLAESVVHLRDILAQVNGTNAADAGMIKDIQDTLKEIKCAANRAGTDSVWRMLWYRNSPPTT